MTPHEKAVAAINTRLERLQANLRDAKVESAQRFLFQSIVVTIGIAEALNDFLRAIGAYAQRRHGAVKEANEALGAQHAELLGSGKELLERLKADPSDRTLRKEIDRVQQEMATIQKTLRRGANALQRELAPSLAMIDEIAVTVRRLSEADQADALKRVLTTVVEQVRDFYDAQPGVSARDFFDALAWQSSATSEIDQASDFYDAFARAGYQVVLALELMAAILAENPPRTAEAAAQRANEAVAARIKDVTARLTAP